MSSNSKMLIPITFFFEAVVKKNMLNQFVEMKSRISYLLILVLIAWFIHKWIFSFSNWFPISLLLFASTQVSTCLQLLNSYNCVFGNVTPLEQCEWLNMLLTQIRSDYFNPKLTKRLSAIVNGYQERVEEQEFSLGSRPPSLDLQGMRWSTSGDQRVLKMDFDWDTSEMSILMVAKLAVGTARIVISSLPIKGDVVMKTKVAPPPTRPTPVWNETFEVDENSGDEYLNVKCFSEEIFGDENIGSAHVNLEGLVEGSIRDVWVPLEGVNSGELKLKIEAIRVDDKEGSKGPTSGTAKANGWIELVLIEARYLIAADLRGTSDPYVRVNYGSLKKRTKLPVTPILDGTALLYSFVSTPEVRIGIAFGSRGSQSSTELPGVSPWLVRIVVKDWQFSDGSHSLTNLHASPPKSLKGSSNLLSKTGRKLKITVVKAKDLAANDNHSVSPINGQDMWPKPNVDTEEMLPPEYKRGSGRPKKVRIREFGEVNRGRFRRKMAVIWFIATLLYPVASVETMEPETVIHPSTWVPMFILLGIGLLAFIIAIICCLKARKKIERDLDTEETRRLFYGSDRHVIEMINMEEGLEEGDNEGIEAPYVEFEEIVVATNDFSTSNVLGKGGYGTVYKGMLDGREVAVKRLSGVSSQGYIEFKNEAVLISMLKHRNLVRLRGFCVREDEKILVYEYMENKSLDSFIFDPTKSLLLDWTKRVDIIIGIAKGLVYLHQDSRVKVIHRDLKSSNILLGKNMEAKISDFGLAKLCGEDESERFTHRRAGTVGYMAPEYAYRGVFSTKSDVFAFGVILIEIISGKKNTQVTDDYSTLCTYTWRLWRDNKLLDLIDRSLERSYNADELNRLVCIGLLCVQDIPDDRPGMEEVVHMLLDNENAILRNPKEPTFSPRQNPATNIASSSTVPPDSSILEGR